jgi:hypothetical protein
MRDGLLGRPYSAASCGLGRLERFASKGLIRSNRAERRPSGGTSAGQHGQGANDRGCQSLFGLQQ